MAPAPDERKRQAMTDQAGQANAKPTGARRRGWLEPMYAAIFGASPADGAASADAAVRRGALGRVPSPPGMTPWSKPCAARGGRSTARSYRCGGVLTMMFPRRKAIERICGVALMVVLATVSASAQGRWPAEFMASFDFYSIDMTPVAVTLRNPNDADSAHKTLLHIPRAAIVYANNYDASRMPQLPDAIETNDIQLALTYPDGKPLSLHAAEMAAAEKISAAAAIKALRLQQYSGNVGYSAPNNPWEELVREGLARLEIVDTYEGMPHGPADNYLGQQGIDEFMHVHCYPEATPIYFCSTEMRIGPTLVAQVSFADFRFHGGRAYANERARKFREIVCRYTVPQC
jgi:hypothetical protein